MKASLVIGIAAAFLGNAIAQESPVGVPPDAPAGIDPAPETSTDTPAPDPSGLTTPGSDTPAAPVFDLQATNNARLEQTLTRARQLAADGQLAEAGGLLFHAAAALEALSDPTRRDVSEAVASLRVLAFDIASHRAQAPAQFRDAAASAHLSLATEQVLQARGAWDERRSVATGQALQLAAFHLRHTLNWSERAPSTGGTSTLSTADQIGTALIQADPLNPVSPATVNASIDQVAKMTATIGRALVAARSKDGLDERISEASRNAIDGIKKGTRKAAEKIGDRLQRWGSALQGQ